MGAGQAVIAMASLAVQREQTIVLEPGQVGAGGGGADPGNRRHLGAGARMAIHQRAEHFCPRRFRNRTCDM